MTDRGLEKKLHKMMPIKLFLIDIMQISFMDWIENSIADIGREIAPTDIFQVLNRQNNSPHQASNSRDWHFSAGIAQFFLQTPAEDVSLG